MAARGQEFYSRVYTIARELGANKVQASLAAAQAATETAYGVEVEGNNYFGIKAGRNYPGKKLDVVTHEERDGTLVKEVHSFRAYDSLVESVRDYMGLMASKYPDTWNSESFAEAMEHITPYATNSNYTSMLTGVSGPRSMVAEFEYAPPLTPETMNRYGVGLNSPVRPPIDDVVLEPPRLIGTRYGRPPLATRSPKYQPAAKRPLSALAEGAIPIPTPSPRKADRPRPVPPGISIPVPIPAPRQTDPIGDFLREGSLVPGGTVTGMSTHSVDLPDMAALVDQYAAYGQGRVLAQATATVDRQADDLGYLEGPVYALGSAQRSLQPSSRIGELTQDVVSDVLGEGHKVVVTSGMEKPDQDPVNSPYRHPPGYAVDFYVQDPAGEMITDESALKDVAMAMAARHGANIGYSKFTEKPGRYMGPGMMHVDIAPLSGLMGPQWGRTAKEWAAGLNEARRQGINHPAALIDIPIPTPRPDYPADQVPIAPVPNARETMLTPVAPQAYPLDPALAAAVAAQQRAAVPQTRFLTPDLLEYAAPPASYNPLSFDPQSTLTPSASPIQPSDVGVLSDEYAAPVAAVTPMASSPYTGHQAPTGVLSPEYAASLGPLDSIDIRGSAPAIGIQRTRSMSPVVEQTMPAETSVDVVNRSILNPDGLSTFPSSAPLTGSTVMQASTVQPGQQSSLGVGILSSRPTMGPLAVSVTPPSTFETLGPIADSSIFSSDIPSIVRSSVATQPAAQPNRALAVTPPNAVDQVQTARNTLLGGLLGSVIGGLAERARDGGGLLSGPFSGMQAPGQWMGGNFAQNDAFSTNPSSAIDPNTGWQSFTNQHGVTTLTGGLKAFPEDAQPMVSNAGIGGGPSAGKGG